jgi:diguanylate cyclase (GGDEF)-like protein/PAS domain S-box-containing protein
MLPLFDNVASRLGHAQITRLLVGCGLLIGIALALTTGWYIVSTRQVTIDDASREMRNDSLMLAEEQDRLLQAVSSVQLGLIAHMRELDVDTPEKFEQTMASRAVRENLHERIAGLPYVLSLGLLTADGRLLNRSHSLPTVAINDANRDFVRALTGPGGLPDFISEPAVSQASGRWVIFLSRRFDAPDGALIGVVLNTIEIDYFEQFYARLPLTGGGAFALYRRDGILLARYPRLDGVIGKSFADKPSFQAVSAALASGRGRTPSALDGMDRLLSPHAMEHFPLIVSVSDTMDSILRVWRQQVRVLAGSAVLLELLIAGTILLAVRHLRAQHNLREAESARARAEAELAITEEHRRSERALRLSEQRFDTALNHMRQGLCMYDNEMCIVVANRRFSELFALPCEIVPGTSYTDVSAMVVANGTVSQEDMDRLRDQRRELVTAKSPISFPWELLDGRTIMINHQPMEAGWLTTYEDITERREAEARIAHISRHDGLTGLPNRVLFREDLERALAFATRGYLLALLYLDLDHFKSVNDTLGHPIGDEVLREVGRRLRDALRKTDTVARLGGDEFAVIQTDIASPIDATGLAALLIEVIAVPFEIDGHEIVIGASIGVAFAPQDAVDPDKLLKCGDLALNRAKQDGRGVWRLFQPEMDAKMQQRRVMELELRQALLADQLELFFQPQINTRTRRVAGCEALLRWRHPKRGLVPPVEFIPLAEETGMIVPIGEWVLRRACAAAAGWPNDLRVAVNLSAVQFKNRNLIGAIIAALESSGLDPERLELEITESIMLRDTESTLATLHQLRDLGVQIAMDDFGTGYSSLSYLRQFPFDRIKIDQSFVRELGRQRDALAIVRAVTTLGLELGMAITAEGVETQQQLEVLEQVGCTEIQGYLFSRPVAEPALLALLQSLRFTIDNEHARGEPEPARRETTALEAALAT